MSAWRKKAIELLPKLKEVVEKSDSVGMLWVDLWFIFVQAHKEPIDEETIRGAYLFAEWTLRHGTRESQTSTCFHFYEHLLFEPEVRKKIRKYISKSDVLQMTEIMKCQLSDDDFKRVVEECFPPAKEFLKGRKIK